MPAGFHRISLASPPEIRSSGAFSDAETKLEWDQPSDSFHAQVHNEPGTLVVNGQPWSFLAGDLLVVAPGSRCKIQRPLVQDNTYIYFSFVPAKAEQDLYAIRYVTSLGEDVQMWDLLFRRALYQLQVTRTAMRSVVWSILWSVAAPEQVSPPNPYVAAAVRLFEERIAESMSIAAVARDCHLSPSQLNRLFLAEHGRTPLQMLLEIRAARAHELLTTTTLPIKAVAAACGIPDAHAFNRFVRTRLGSSPRSIRLGTAFIDTFRIANLGVRHK